MGNNLYSFTVVEIYGQQYSVVKLVPLRCIITLYKVPSPNAAAYAIVPLTDINVRTNTKNFLMSYAIIGPEFWIDRQAVYTADEVDFGFNIKDLAIAEDFTFQAVPTVGSGISGQSQYFGKDKMLADEIVTFPEINWETPLMWTYWDTPQSNPAIEFKGTNRSTTTDFDIYFTASLVKLHIIPDDLVDPTVD